MTMQDLQALEENPALRCADTWLDRPLDAAPDDRRDFLMGLRALRDGDLGAAAKLLRRARRSAAPFGDLATLALAEVQRLNGQQGAALRTLHRLADDETCAALSRRAAWMSIGALEEARENPRGVALAQDALAALPEGAPDAPA